MKRVFQSQSFFIVLSVLYVITGIVILFWPNLTMPLMGTAFSIGMLVVGCTNMIIYFTKDHFNSILSIDLTIGVVFAAFGAFMLMHRDFVEILIPFAVAILLLMGAMIKIQYAFDMRQLRVKHWKLMLLFVFLLAVAGIVLLYNPFKGNVLLYFIGGAMIFEGILNIFSILFVSHRMKQISRGKFPVEPGPAAHHLPPNNAPAPFEEPAPAPAAPPVIDPEPGDGAVELYRENHQGVEK